jgi:hypothetical protein
MTDTFPLMLCPEASSFSIHDIATTLQPGWLANGWSLGEAAANAKY